MSANAEIIAELRRVLNERDEAREQLDLTKRELGRWVDREAKAVRERDEAREERDLVRERFENAVQSATRYAVERDEWRDKFHALNQTAGELCNACGWAFKIPGESCRCEVVKERDEARADAERYLADLRRCASEPYERTRELEALQAEVERLRETKDYLRTWLSSEELEGLRVKAAEHPLLWEEIHHLKDEVERLSRLLKMAEDEAVAADDHGRREARRADAAEADAERLGAERDEARAERDNLLDTRSEGAWMARALDAERMAAEAEKLSDAAKAAWDAECIMREQRDRFHAEWKQERQEVERLRVELIRAGSRECDIAACNCGTWHHQSPRAAYRRGAEAMREACAQWIPYIIHTDCNPEEKMRALPIPEEP